MTSVNWTNLTSFADLPAQANVVTDGIFWSSMLYMMWVILLLVFIGYGLEIALLASSFLAMILGILLLYAGLVSLTVILPFVGLILLMFLYIVWSSYKVKLG